MFDWLEIDLSRFTQPIVIAGLVIMVLGLVLVLTSKQIGKAILDKTQKDNTVIVYVISTIILLVGVFMTILGAK